MAKDKGKGGAVAPEDRESVAGEAAFQWVMKLFAGKAGLEVTPSSGTPSLAQGFRIKLWSAPDA